MQTNSEESKHVVVFSPDVTLKRRACVSLVAALFNEKTFCCYIKEGFLVENSDKDLHDMTIPLKTCVGQLDLPNTLKLELIDLIPVIGLGMHHWISIINYSCQLAFTYNKLPVKLHFIWTGKGTFDFIKTTKAIIDSNPSNNILCYCLASLFCIEETLSNPDASAHIEYIHNLCKSFPGEKSLPDFLEFWKENLNPGAVNFDAILTPARSERGYNLAMQIKCVPVLKYFFDRLHPERKLPIIWESFKSAGTNPDDYYVLHFLLSNIQVPEINKIICKFAYKALNCFLQWPYQECFMPVANSYLNYLSKKELEDLIFDITVRALLFKCSVYAKLFEEFCQLLPSEFQEYFINECLPSKGFEEWINNRLLGE